MKRLIPFITAFIILFNIPLNLFTASSAIPTVIPDFTDVTNTSLYSDFYYGSILLWDENEQEFIMYMFRTPYQNLNSSYITLVDVNTYPSETPVKGPTFKIGNQSHLQGGDLYRLFCDGYYTNPYKVKLKFSSYTEQNVSNLSNLTYWCTVPTIEAQEQTSRTVIASDVDIMFNDEILYKGNAGLLQSYFSDNSLGYNEVIFTNRPVYDPNAGQEGGGEFDTNYDEVQVETSKGILENVKNIITYIANLPANIANNIKGFFEQLALRIEIGFTDLKDGLIQSLKDLFIPSEENYFAQFKNAINERFAFISQIKELKSAFVHYTFADSDTPPEFNINYKGKEISIIDWSFYAPYRMTVHFIIIVISYLSFIIRLYKRIPSYIGGFY